jgi:hypothetical protein
VARTGATDLTMHGPPLQVAPKRTTNEKTCWQCHLPEVGVIGAASDHMTFVQSCAASLCPVLYREGNALCSGRISSCDLVGDGDFDVTDVLLSASERRVSLKVCRNVVVASAW